MHQANTHARSVVVNAIAIRASTSENPAALDDISERPSRFRAHEPHVFPASAKEGAGSRRHCTPHIDDLHLHNRRVGVGHSLNRPATDEVRAGRRHLAAAKRPAMAIDEVETAVDVCIERSGWGQVEPEIEIGKGALRASPARRPRRTKFGPLEDWCGSPAQRAGRDAASGPDDKAHRHKDLEQRRSACAASGFDNDVSHVGTRSNGRSMVSR